MMMVNNQLLIIAIISATLINSLSCGESSRKSPKINRWDYHEYSIGYTPAVDYSRGSLYGWSSSVMQHQLGRKDSKIAPGDYLDGPTLALPKPIPIRPDSISVSLLANYLRDILRPEFCSDKIMELIANYMSVLNDSTRDEFFGRFIVDGHKFSLGGWYGKFAVVGIYTTFNNSMEFLSEANKYFVLPLIIPDSIQSTKTERNYFYEYIDEAGSFRLRGFPAYFSPKKNQNDSFHTMVIEFTKYYDPEFVPWGK